MNNLFKKIHTKLQHLPPHTHSAPLNCHSVNHTLNLKMHNMLDVSSSKINVNFSKRLEKFPDILWQPISNPNVLTKVLEFCSRLP